MIVVTVALHSAINGRVSELGRMVISNDGTGENTHGNYDVRLGRKGASLERVLDQPQRRGRVERHARLAQSVWSLVAKALLAVGHGDALGKFTTLAQIDARRAAILKHEF